MTAVHSNDVQPELIEIADNQQENKTARDVVVKLGLSQGPAEQLHRAISGQGNGYYEILEETRSEFNK